MVQTELTGEQRQTAPWSEIDWTATEAVVKRLQGRIYRAAAAGNGRRVKNLQKLLVRSTSAKRLAVRRVIPAAPLIDRWPRLWLPGVARRMGRRAEPMGHPIGPLVLDARQRRRCAIGR